MLVYYCKSLEYEIVVCNACIGTLSRDKVDGITTHDKFKYVPSYYTFTTEKFPFEVSTNARSTLLWKIAFTVDLYTYRYRQFNFMHQSNFWVSDVFVFHLTIHHSFHQLKSKLNTVHLCLKTCDELSISFRWILHNFTLRKFSLTLLSYRFHYRQ